MWATTLLHHPAPALQWGVVLGAALVAARWDLRERRIPNALTGTLAASGLAAALVVGGGAGLVDALLGGTLLAAPYVVLWAFAGGGAGDAKMMGAIGTWTGVVLGALCLVTTSLAGVVLALVWSARAGRLRAVLARVVVAARGVCVPLFGGGSAGDVRRAMPPVGGAQTFPYGIAILVGTLLSSGVVFLWE